MGGRRQHVWFSNEWAGWVWLLVGPGVPPGVALSPNSFVMDRERWLSTWLLSGAFPLALSKGSLWPDSFCALGAHHGRFCRESPKWAGEL